MRAAKLNGPFGLPGWWFVFLGVWGITGAPLWLYLVVFGAPLGAGLFPLLPEWHGAFARILFAIVLYQPFLLLPFALLAKRRRRRESADA